MVISQNQRPNYEQKEMSLDLIDGDLAKALDYWRSLTLDDCLPSWSDFDFMKIPLSLIPKSHVCDAIDGGQDFLCRFWGTAVTDLVGINMTGKLISTMSPSTQLVDTMIREMRKTVTSKKPRLLSSHLHHQYGSSIFQILLRLPLTNNDGEVAHCLTLAEYLFDYDQSKKHFESLKQPSASVVAE